MNILQRRLGVISAFFLLLLGSNVLAQSPKDKALLSLLKTLPEVKESTLGVYTLNSSTKITDVVLINDKVIVESGLSRTGWSKVRFQRKLVPVWVSAQYVEQKNNIAKVVANVLNGRIQPSIHAEKVNVFKFGHKGEVLAKRDGFVQIKAPVDAFFMAKNEQLNQLQSAQVLTVNSTLKPQLADATTNSSVSYQQSLNLDQSRQPAAQVNVPVYAFKEDASQSHIIAPGDSISLLVFGEGDLSREDVRVPENGNVSLPLIGEVSVAGKTTKQVEAEIKSILSSGYVKNPKLSVSIFSYRPIFIRGAVQSTGAFPYAEGLSVAKALALAGGAINSAKQNGISVLRDGNVVESGLSLDSQYQVSSGDVISIEEERGVRDDENLFIYMHGEVANPGEYRYRKGLTVEKAIALSGGFTARASRRKVNITRYVDVGENQEPTTLKKVKLYITIMPGDVINVRASLF